MVSPQVPQEEYPADDCQWWKLPKEFPNSTRQGYSAELARGLSHASLAHKNPIKVRGRHRGRPDGRSKTQRLDAPGRPRSPRPAWAEDSRPITKSGQGNSYWTGFKFLS